MKAMILAAGLGTRLRPLTDTRPKALVEIAGRTLLEITLTRLRSFGVNEVIINVHHFAEDRKSTRLNSSHITISYAVFCLKKKKQKQLKQLVTIYEYCQYTNTKTK